ncbi:MAG: DUF1579 domain-containing protein [Gemmataceae bacterium]|nr:DUF1579 domain-containing protein [Gemmataceae bacterium]
MKLRTLLALALTAGALGLLSAQGLSAGDKKEGGNPFDKLPGPGPEHKMLARMAGTWEAKVKAYFDPSKPPTESTGIMKRTMILDGRYLQEEYTGEVFGSKFRGQGLVGYDVPKKKFVSAWVDSMSTGIMLTYGTYDSASKTFTYRGQEKDPFSGKEMKTRDVVKIVSDDEQLFEMYREPIGAKEFKMLEIHLTRKKK